MKRVIYFLIMSFYLISCEEEINLELPQAKPKLVIEGNIQKRYDENGCSNCWVKLTLTSPFFSNNNPIISDDEAKVELINIENDRVFELKDERDNRFDGRFDVINNSPNSFIPEFNTSYKLRVIYKNEVYESTIEQLTPTSPIDSLEQGEGILFEGNEKEVIISFTDSPERNDFFLFRFGFDYLTSKDEFYQGNQFSFSYFFDESVGVSDVGIPIRIYGINEQYYNYMNILLSQIGDGGPFETVPTNAKSNITNISNPDNQPLGYFRIAEFDEKLIVLE